MESQLRQKVRHRRSRSLRVRKKVRAVSSIPRMSIFKSIRHLYVQLIDDSSGLTICSSSTLAKGLREKFPNGKSLGAAQEIGRIVAELAVAKGVTKVVFDRGHRTYHGLVRAIADSARASGLQF